MSPFLARRRVPSPGRGPRGFALPLVFAVLALLSFTVVGMMASSTHNAEVTRLGLYQRKAFFIADDLCRVVGRLGDDYFSQGEHVEVDEACDGDLACDFERFVSAPSGEGSNSAALPRPATRQASPFAASRHPRARRCRCPPGPSRACSPSSIGSTTASPFATRSTTPPLPAASS